MRGGQNVQRVETTNKGRKEVMRYAEDMGKRKEVGPRLTKKLVTLARQPSGGSGKLPAGS
jgi:hypothetical protein